jgi:hypothetical protein
VRRDSIRLLRLGEPDAAERIGEVFGEMFAIRAEQPRAALSVLAQGRE